ncbi:hypothetical protein Mal52_20500 [Symmachiella dynata]|uniref:Uncharacterized protein n=1 Tax=Symmachiella dynata TaxID=2527995 RepID=A0A517ZM76_9PLAN|nr:hypothetical protein Mal52_20500 [Symmachiella dynata]
MHWVRCDVPLAYGLRQKKASRKDAKPQRRQKRVSCLSAFVKTWECRAAIRTSDHLEYVINGEGEAPAEPRWIKTLNKSVGSLHAQGKKAAQQELRPPAALN